MLEKQVEGWEYSSIQLYRRIWPGESEGGVVIRTGVQ